MRLVASPRRVSPGESINCQLYNMGAGGAATVIGGQAGVLIFANGFRVQVHWAACVHGRPSALGRW